MQCRGYHLINCVHVQIYCRHFEVRGFLQMWLQRLILISLCTLMFVDACSYLGEWPPVHVSAPDVNVLPIHNHKRGMESSSGESCHIHEMNHCIRMGWETERGERALKEWWRREWWTFANRPSTVWQEKNGNEGEQPARRSLWQNSSQVHSHIHNVLTLIVYFGRQEGFMTCAVELLDEAACCFLALCNV